MHAWTLLAIAWAIMIVVMAITWAIAQRIGNAGIVDAVWTFSVGICGVVFAAICEGEPTRRAIVACVAAVWSIRLGLHILLRMLREPEDGRYREMKAEWGDRASTRLFLFFQYQAFGAVLFASPLLVAAKNQTPLNVLDFLAIGIFVISIAAEALADRQLANFKHNPANRGKVCRDGLWKYSRHPNYFFEWLHWWTYVLLAVTGPWGWLALVGPLAMLYFLLFVTGVPPTERQSLRSRGDAYREYQRTTSAFFPWFPRS